MFNSLQPDGTQPARLLCPWDSPGKNSGVGCHALLQGICHNEEPINVRYQIYNPDYVVVLDDGLLNVVDVFSGIKEKSEVIINTTGEIEGATHTVYDIDATGIALENLGVNIVNTIILGYFAKKTGAVSIESILEVIKETFPGRLGEKNVIAAQKAYDMA